MAPRDLRTYLEKLPDATFLVSAHDLRILDTNVRSGTIFGYPAETLLSRSLSELLIGGTPELVGRALEGQHDPHPDTPLRLSVRWHGGGEAPVDLRVTRASEGEDEQLLVVAVRRVSEAARIAERELVTIVCAAPGAIVTWNLSDRRIVSFNPAAERLYGMRTEDALGQSVDVLVPATACEELLLAEKRIVESGDLPMREVSRLRSGLEIAVEERLFLIKDVGQHVLRVGSMSQEVTELQGLRRATEILSDTEKSAADGPKGETGTAMSHVYALADTAALDPHVTVLLLGETGVGKSRLARRIHARSTRARRPFLEINCASFDANLVESELFGHERGAFTGASHPKRGLVEAAAGGTLFLDEIGELPLAVQSKLLSFLDDRNFRRVGGVVNLRADLRLIAATNADLEALVAAGTFRSDLYYRLRVMPVHVPPLRDRSSEIPEMAAAILEELRRGAKDVKLTRELTRALTRYGWPGNLRELRNALERALILARGGPLALEHLPPEVLAAADPRKLGTDGDARLAGVERRHIERVLASAGGNRTVAAEMLGISRSTLNRKIVEWSQAPGRAAMAGERPPKV